MNNTIDTLKNPKRNLPCSILIALVAAILIYVLTFSSYFTALTAYDIINSDATAVTFAERVLPLFLYVLPIGVTLSCLTGKSALFLFR